MSTVATALPTVFPRDLARGVVVGSPAEQARLFVVDGLAILVFGATAAGLVGWAARAVTHHWSVPWLVIGAVVGVAIGFGVAVQAYRRHGRFVGGYALGFRCVDDTQFLPTVPTRKAPGRAGFVAVNVRRGLDPLAAIAPPWHGLTVVGGNYSDLTTPPVTTARRGVPAGSIALVFDSGQVHWFSGVCILGRSPVALSGEDALSLPDLSRTLSASHVRIGETPGAGEGSGLWVVDQGSPSGTWVETGTQYTRLPAATRVSIASGTVLKVGNYRLRVDKVES